MKGRYGRWFLALLVSSVLATPSGCTSPTPIAYAVRFGDIAVVPAAATTETPVRLTFTVICHHFCGSGHGNMKMTITVQ